MDAPQRVQKHTVASNADAIAGLSTRVSGIGSAVESMTEMLSDIATKMELTVTNDHADPTATGSQPTHQHSRPSLVEPQPGTSLADGSPTPGQPRHHPRPGRHAPFGEVQESGQHHRLDSYGSPVCNHPPLLPAGCRNRQATHGRRPTTDASTHVGWEPPTTITELEADQGLARTVAEAIQAAVALIATGAKGRHEQAFPSYYVTRGLKRTRAQLGECTFPEYMYGYMQLMKTVKSREVWVDMNRHLEQVVNDARTYPWPSVRAWSEEVCAHVAEGKLAWSDQYETDRLQTRISHASPQQAAGLGDLKGSNILAEASEAVRLARPAPPCRAYQSGSCPDYNHHVSNGFRALHICEFCLMNKCLYLLHPKRDCRSKSYKKPSPYTAQPSGFGN